MKDIAEHLKREKPNLSPNSLKVYTLNLQKIFKGIDLDNEDITVKNIAKKKEEIYKFLVAYPDNTARNYMNALIMFIKTLDGKNDKLLEDLGERRDKLHTTYKNKVANHEKSDKQKENWLEWEDIQQVFKDLQNQVKALRLKVKNKQKTLSPAEKMIFQDYLLLGLFVLQPPTRNDYAEMKVLTRKEYNAMNETEKEASNYYIKDTKGKSSFIYNEYKTKKKYGKKERTVPQDLERIINAWLKINDTGYLLITRSGTPLTANGITKHLTRIFKKEVGKNISSSMLRHIYLSSKYGEEVKSKKEDAEGMMHSVDQQQDYVLTD